MEWSSKLKGKSQQEKTPATGKQVESKLSETLITKYEEDQQPSS